MPNLNRDKEFIMVKKIAIALLCTALGSSLYARDISEGKGFIGLEVGAATVQGDTYYKPGHEGNAVEFGLRIGAQKDEWRTMFAFDYFDSSSDDQNIEKSFLMVDYFLYESDAEIKIKPFIGLNLGYVNYESTFVDVSDFAYGAQAGVTVGITEYLDLDLSYRYSLSSADELDNMGSIVFGVNYLY
jgi:hypothetical protein